MTNRPKSDLHRFAEWITRVDAFARAHGLSGVSEGTAEPIPVKAVEALVIDSDVTGLLIHTPHAVTEDAIHALQQAWEEAFAGTRAGKLPTVVLCDGITVSTVREPVGSYSVQTGGEDQAEEVQRLRDGLREIVSCTALYGEHAGERAAELLRTPGDIYGEVEGVPCKASRHGKVWVLSITDDPAFLRLVSSCGDGRLLSFGEWELTVAGQQNDASGKPTLLCVEAPEPTGGR